MRAHEFIIEGDRPIDKLNSQKDTLNYTKKIGQVVSLVKKIKQHLPPNAQNAISTWSQGIQSSGNNPLENPKILAILESEFLPVRELLIKLFGTHIMLYRGEKPRSNDTELHSGGREIYSWTANPKIANIHANHSQLLPEFSDDAIKKTLNQYKNTGYAKLGDYSFISSKTDTDWFNLYYKKEYQTEYENDEIEDVLQDIKNDRKSQNTNIHSNQGNVYKKSISIDDIVWLMDAHNFTELEFIVKGGDHLTTT